MYVLLLLIGCNERLRVMVRIALGTYHTFEQCAQVFWSIAIAGYVNACATYCITVDIHSGSVFFFQMLSLQSAARRIIGTKLLCRYSSFPSSIESIIASNAVHENGKKSKIKKPEPIAAFKSMLAERNRLSCAFQSLTDFISSR